MCGQILGRLRRHCQEQGPSGTPRIVLIHQPNTGTDSHGAAPPRQPSCLGQSHRAMHSLASQFFTTPSSLQTFWMFLMYCGRASKDGRREINRWIKHFLEGSWFPGKVETIFELNCTSFLLTLFSDLTRLAFFWRGPHLKTTSDSTHSARPHFRRPWTISHGKI